MMVVLTQSESRALKSVITHAEKGDIKQCFYLKFSQSDLPKVTAYKALLELLGDIPNSYVAQIYIFHDQDVLFMMPGFLQHNFVKLIGQLSAALNVPSLLDVATVFDLAKDKDNIEALCKQKLERFEQEQRLIQEEKRQEKASEKTLKALENLDSLALKELAFSRDNRKEPTIMIVDDDHISRTLVNNVLHREYNLTFAANGVEALEKYVESAPDVLFLDIGLPDISGHDLLETLSQIDPDHYIIMFSGRKDQDNMLKALRLGAQGFVAKPFSRAKLDHYINKSPYIQNKSYLVDVPTTHSRSS